MISGEKQHLFSRDCLVNKLFKGELLKNVFIMILLFCLFLSCGCTERKISEKIKELKVDMLKDLKMNSKEIPFVLNFPGWENRPVGIIQLGDKEYFVGLDTGSSSSVDMTLFSRGIKKMYGSEKKFINKIFTEAKEFKYAKKKRAIKQYVVV